MLTVYLSVAGRGTNKKQPCRFGGAVFYAYLINMCAGYVEKCAGGYKGNFGSGKFRHQHRMTNHQLLLNNETLLSLL